MKRGKSSFGGRIAILVVALMLLTGAVVMLMSVSKLEQPAAPTAPLGGP